MKLLTATHHTQGHRSNDFHHADEGEIVTFGSECDGEEIDGRCGCRRSLSGIRTKKASTTFRVTECPEVSDRWALASMIVDSLISGGWFKDRNDPEAQRLADADAAGLAQMAAAFQEGTILERRSSRFRTRPTHEGKTTPPPTRNTTKEG